MQVSVFVLQFEPWASFCAIKKHSSALEKATIALMPLFLDSACSFSYPVWHDYFQKDIQYTLN